jgi:hypothetical protein
MEDYRDCEECGLTGSPLVIHEHHILPVRLGGSEEPDNKVLLCPYCHSMRHLDLYLNHSDDRDLIAFRGLSGMVNKEEIVSELRALGVARGQQAVKELWKDPEWRDNRLPQVLDLQAKNQERLKQLREDEEWSKEWKEKLNANLEKARKKNKEEPSAAYLENIKSFPQRSREACEKLRRENPE